MSDFCKECGNPISEGAMFCKNCGAKVNKILSESESQKEQAATNNQAESQVSTSQDKSENSTQYGQETPKEKKPLSKKQKLIFSLAGVLAIAGIGFYIWGNSYYAEEKVVERFVEALVEEDADELHSLVRMNGNEISEEEAKALAQLAGENHRNVNINENRPERVISDGTLFSVEEADEKGMLVFTQYIIELEPQYVSINSDLEDVQTTFNGKEFDISEQTSYSIEYGPIAPGAYEAISKISTDFGDLEKEQTVVLADYYNSSSLEFDVSEVTIYPNLETNLPYDEITFTIDGQPVEIDLTEYSVDIGPILTDGSLTLDTNVETPWGAMEMDPVAIDDRFVDVNIDFFNDTIKEDMADSVVQFAEEYIAAIANHDTSNMEYVSDYVKEDMEFDFEYFSDELYFEGSLDEVGISFADLEEMYTYSDDGPYFEVPVELYVTGALEEGADQEEGALPLLLEIRYQDDKWIAERLYDSSYTTATEFELYDGSGAVYEASGSSSDDADDEEDE
ncbi:MULTISPECIES: zinc ribbon domain-containing protein [Oceanobacillus]|uniref:zinc ribbon domain-containing protein n=2 Tax=Bacillaceae TaxID=186817 RepID=UPI003639F620